MIELNPFDSYTDGALFLWQLHRYKQTPSQQPTARLKVHLVRTVLEEGPFTFRWVTEAEDVKKKTWWKKILADYEAKTQK